MKKIRLEVTKSYRKKLQELEVVVDDINKYVIMEFDVEAKISTIEDNKDNEHLLYQLRGALEDARYQISIRKKSYYDKLLDIESEHRNMLNEIRELKS